MTSFDLRDNGRAGDQGPLREGRPRSGGVRGVNCVGTRYQSSNNSTAGEADVEAGAASLARRIRVMICTRSTQRRLVLINVRHSYSRSVAAQLEARHELALVHDALLSERPLGVLHELLLEVGSRKLKLRLTLGWHER